MKLSNPDGANPLIKCNDDNTIDVNKSKYFGGYYFT